MKPLAVFLLCAAATAQPTRFLPGTQPFVAIDAAVVALQHVRVIDGTGAPARDDQTVILDHGKISAVGPSASTSPPAGARVMGLRRTHRHPRPGRHA